jgi:outer membrane protein assembly factor BamD
MKSADNEAKYAAAVDYYEKKDYFRALQLIEQLIPFYKGTQKSELLMYYQANCYYHQGDSYTLASYYFKKFRDNYPRSQYAETAMFLSAYCYYLDSPKSSLDQSNTYEAINQMQLFMDAYPKSDSLETCIRLMDQLSLKLEKKDFDIAKLYYKMAQYEAAVVSFNNLLKEYPDTQFKEEILYYIFKSNYYFALYSISAKQDDRFQAAIDSYNELVFQYPETEFLKEANAMFNNVQKKISN